MSGETNPEFKYWAFISYSHRDKAWGDWLHRALETYRVPKKLVGQPTTRGERVPARIFPVFRDREELPTAADLGANLKNAIEQSRYLIIICSPSSAKSQWVNEEILTFKRLGRANRVLALIVDGEPWASLAKPGVAVERECFPPALRFQLGADGQLSDVQAEPIAADARVHADGRQNALLKLLAGVVGVNYDDLRQREKIRRRRRRMWLGGLAAAALAVSAVVWTRFDAAEREKRFEAAQAEIGRARQALAAGEPTRAARLALGAIERAEDARRELEPAWHVLRRALDGHRVERVWEAHRQRVSAVGFDGRGERLLTASEALEEVRVWSAATGEELTKLETGPLELAAWTESGDEIVTLRTQFEDGEQRAELTWWNPQTGVVVRKTALPGAAGFVRPDVGTVSPRWIVLNDFSGEEATQRLVRLSDGFAERTIPIRAGVWGRAEVLPEVGVVLRIQADTGVTVFSLSDGGERCALEGIGPLERIGLKSIVASMDGKRIAAVVTSDDQPAMAGVWDVQSGARIAHYEAGAGEHVTDLWLHAAPDGRVIGRSEGLLAVVAEPLGRMPVQVSARSAVIAWSDGTADSGPIAASIAFGGIAELWFPLLGLKSEISGVEDALTAVALSPDAKRFAVGDAAGNLKLWRLVAPVDREAELPDRVQMAAMSGTGDVLLKGGAGELLIWDVGERNVLARWSAGGRSRESGGLRAWGESTARYVWREEEGWLAVLPPSGDEEAVVTFYDTREGTLLGRYPKNGDEEVQLAPRGRRALVRKGDGSWEIVNLGKEGAAVVSLAAEPVKGETWGFSAGFTADGQKVIASPGRGWLEVFSAETGASEKRFKFADAVNFDVSLIVPHPTENAVLVGTLEGVWKVDLSSATGVRAFAEATTLVGETVFDPTGRLLISNQDGRLRWWRWPELQPAGDVHGEFRPGLTAVLEDGESLLVVERLLEGWPGAAAVVARDGGKERLRLENVLAADGRLGLAAVQDVNVVRVVRLRDGEVLAEVPDVRATQASFAKDGSRVGLVLLDSERYVSLRVAVEREELRARARELGRE